MLRSQALLLASLALSVGCASSKSNNVNNPEDAGAVDYDAGGGAAAGGEGEGGDQGDADGGGATVKGKDQTNTRAIGVPRKAVKKLAAVKPPREDEPAAEPPKRTGRQPAPVTPNGLLVEYFNVDAATAEMPDFSTFAAPLAYAIAPNIDVAAGSRFPGAPSSLGAAFGARFTGSLNVTAAAEYNLCLSSSDGSQLLLDGGLIVDNGGAHETKQTCELVYMDPGEYEVTVLYFNVGDDISLQWTWDAGGAGAVAVPEGALFKPADADAKVKPTRK